MFIEKCLSVLLSFAISINTSSAWNMPTYTDTNLQEPVREEYVIEDIVDVSPIEIQMEPVVEQVEIIEEPIEETVELPLTDDEIDLIALCTMGEAEGECEEGKRLVIDVILNRLDSSRFPDTVHGVIYAKNQFECMWNGRVDRCHVREDIRQLVIEESLSRTNYNVHYFRTKHYHKFGTPVVQVGNHYFSTY